MKKFLALALVMVLALGLAACGGSPKYKDGTYTAEAADFDAQTGWKDVVTVTISEGKITAVDWNAVHKDGGDDKKTQSINGEYGMVAGGGAQSEWHEQATLMEAELIKTQDPSKIKTNSEGRPDAVSGVSIHITGFIELATKALDQAK